MNHECLILNPVKLIDTEFAKKAGKFKINLYFLPFVQTPVISFGMKETVYKTKYVCAVFKSAYAGNNQDAAWSFGSDVFMFTPKWQQGEGRKAGWVCKRDSEISDSYILSKDTFL